MKKLKLNPVNHVKNDTNRYCGPSIISSLTGMSSGAAARLIRRFSGQKAVKGAYVSHVHQALNECGIFFKQPVFDRPDRLKGKVLTLTQWLKCAKKIRNKGRVFLLVAGNHYVAISGNKYICGIVKEACSVRDKRVKRRSRVTHAYELTAPNGVKIPHDMIEKQRSTRSSVYYQVRKLTKEYGFSYERDDLQCRSVGDDILYWVFMPDNAEQLAIDMDHGLACDHTAYSMDGVHSKMLEYVEFMEEYKDQLDV